MGAAGYYLYSGTFDNVYYSSATFTGNLYAMETPARPERICIGYPSLPQPCKLRLPLLAALAGAGGVHGWPSPLNEFCNNGLSACTTDGTKTTAGIDYIFFSVYRGTVGVCTNGAGNGCLLSYNVKNPAAVSLSGSG